MMQKIVLILLMACSCSWGQAELSLDEVKTVEKRVNEIRQTTQTLQMNFVQEIFIKEMSTPTTSKGVLYYSKPARLRVEYTEPSGDFILFNKEIQVVSKKGEAPKVKKVDYQSSSNPSLLQAFEMEPQKWRELYQVKMFPNDKTILVKLENKNKDQQKDAFISVSISKEDYLIRSVKINFPGGWMEYRFSKIKKNLSLSEKLYTWKTK